jgi:hypothetical protein
MAVRKLERRTRGRTCKGIILTTAQPVILNAIEDIVNAPILPSRAILLMLAAVAER